MGWKWGVVTSVCRCGRRSGCGMEGAGLVGKIRCYSCLPIHLDRYPSTRELFLGLFPLWAILGITQRSQEYRSK